MKSTLTLLLLFCFSVLLHAQAKKLFPPSINTRNNDEIALALSADGTKMVFASNYSRSESLELKMSGKVRDWSEPSDLPSINKHREMMYFYGFSLTSDGNTMYFTSRRSPGIGGYDIWKTTFSGTMWNTPENIGKPVNSTGHDAAPTFTPDGKIMYFMRCNEINKTSASGCTLMKSELQSNGRWGAAEALPAPVREGMNPRICADGESLIFARKGEKGDVDLFMSRLQNGNWSEPRPMDFANTEEDDWFGEITAKGSILYTSTTFQESRDLVMVRVPSAFQPHPMFMWRGRVELSSGLPAMDAFVQVWDMEEDQLEQYQRVDATGIFQVFLPTGHNFDVSAFMGDYSTGYDCKLIDLRKINRPILYGDKLILTTLNLGYQWTDPAISFEPMAEELPPSANVGLTRLFRTLKANPDIVVEIGVHTDSLPPPLFETDSITLALDSIRADSSRTVSAHVMDSLSAIHPDMSDAIITALNALPAHQAPDPMDSTYVYDGPLSITVATPQEREITAIQAHYIADVLISKGIPEKQVLPVSYGNRFLVVPNSSEENRAKNRRVEFTVIQKQ